ncbi:hypothetical protein B0T25DRAFT_570915 [Lasiosphaeria hispida]|uniref:DUF676 domain-containing protein n=1 Tax=Lasiosphaeria hispida TaxID=260671 RepID=A0AAJ0MD78_9PEZI|nr:hypothetical protein B0T25DRAFT_570915 [Lasiosphaeria hispida]
MATTGSRQRWRVRGILGAAQLSKEELTDLLLRHPLLQHPSGANMTGVRVVTLAPDVRYGNFQVATVRFDRLPTLLATLKPSDPATISLLLGNNLEDDITIDQRFDGITVLSAPPLQEHTVDILAVSGLGSHAFGSFVHKVSGHMWLSDSLPRDRKSARVMIYGYDSKLQDAASFAQMDDLGTTLLRSLLRLLASSSGGQRRLVLIGHSLGGLLIKEALNQMHDDAKLSRLLAFISGILFFGVPNNGMEIRSLTPIVGDQPNRALVESLSRINPNVLKSQRNKFEKVTEQLKALKMYCFYETEESPTAERDAAGQWKMGGPRECLVDPNSAIDCLPPRLRHGPYTFPVPRTHSDLVKFADHHDNQYQDVLDCLREVCPDQYLFDRLNGSRDHISPNHQKRYWRCLTLDAYEMYEKIYDCCKDDEGNVAYPCFIAQFNVATSSKPTLETIDKTWLRLFRDKPAATTIATSHYSKGFAMATLYMLHVEQYPPNDGGNIDVDKVIMKRREVLRAFGNWAECQCNSDCNVQWNFSNETGLHRGGAPQSCMLVKCVEADWKLGLFTRARKEHAVWEKTQNEWLKGRI